MSDSDEWVEMSKGTQFERTVRWLRACGFAIRNFEVVEVLSGDKTRKVPRICFIVYSATLIQRADALATLLREVHLPVIPATIAASYFPSDGTTVLVLQGVDDSSLPGRLL